MNEIRKQFDHIFKVVSNEGFLRKESLGGEIPFFIAAYPAKEEIKVRIEIRMLKNKLTSKGVEVLEINLFDLVCEILEDEYDGGMEGLFELEKELDEEQFLDALQSVLNIEAVFLPKIKDLIDSSEAQIYFLTEIGMVYPYIRTHTILNNLQSIAKNSPTLTFFPGSYSGLTLNLFGLLKDDNYYRAFNIEKLEL
jgi:hypothetical protein